MSFIVLLFNSKPIFYLRVHFAALEPEQTFLAALHVLHKIQLQVSFYFFHFPNTIPVFSGSINFSCSPTL